MGDEGITRRRMIRTTVGGVAGLSAATSVWGASSAPAPAPVRLVVIGIGNRCRAHLQIIRGLVGRCQATALCDVVPQRAEAGVKLAGGGDIRTFARHTDLLRAGLCDAVVITTPNYTHAPIVLDALTAGLHVL
ncbi:MAG: Gfo/Idh/MocA family oxidoreductase, partial [Planctomycetes bacterium]|nr:Gfo/Idh/MocA family oxidoreductase [Planctomycetota bacterium]